MKLRVNHVVDLDAAKMQWERDNGTFEPLARNTPDYLLYLMLMPNIQNADIYTEDKHEPGQD